MGKAVWVVVEWIKLFQKNSYIYLFINYKNTHTQNIGVWILAVLRWWKNEKHPPPPQNLKGLLSTLRTREKQGLTLRQGSLSKYRTLTCPSLKDVLHLKDQFVPSLGDRWHITMALDFVHPANSLCGSLVRVLPLCARTHASTQLLKLLLPQLLCPCCCCPSRRPLPALDLASPPASCCSQEGEGPSTGKMPSPSTLESWFFKWPLRSVFPQKTHLDFF